MVSPKARRELVGYFEREFDLSERRACSLARVSRSVLRYDSVREPDDPLRERLHALAVQRPRFGYRRLAILLRREGVDANHKRIWRVYRDAGLSVRRKRRKRIAWASRPERCVAAMPNARWSMDFMSDSLVDGRSLRVLNIVDDFSRRAVAMEVDLSLPAQRVIRALEEASELYGSPRSIIVDNGPEFASKVLDAWCYERGIELVFIRPGKPIENAYAESFNGRVREECLNQHAFESVSHARTVIESWCEDYNVIRPHSSLGGLAPEEFLARWASAQTPQPTERAAAVEASVSTNPVPIPYP